MSPIFNTDWYKTGHIKQYPKNTTKVFSNLTPRSVKHFNNVMELDRPIVAFGMRAAVQEMYDLWDAEFFDLPPEDVHEDLNQFSRIITNAIGDENPELWHFVELYQHGSLPLDIRYVPEGTLVAPNTPILTITNTDPKFFWLVNYLETWLSAQVWKTITTASIALQYSQLLTKYADLTGASRDFVGVQGHDFSYRGMAGSDDAKTSGMGHLTSFIGTDTIPAIVNVEKFYGQAAKTHRPIGVSVPATEHSVMCLGGQDTEFETFERLIDQYPSGVISIVSDTWDYWKVITDFAPRLKDKIMERQENALGLAKVVFRPDSGDPVRIIAGYLKHEVVLESDGTYIVKDTGESITYNEYMGSVALLAESFGTTENDKGYKTLNQRVGLIYGDSITLEVANDILSILYLKGFASDNVVFGIGSYTYQYMTRDTLGTAIKATAGIVDGKFVKVQKDPKTDSGTKKSLKGMFVVDPNTLEVKDDLDIEQYTLSDDLLKPHTHHLFESFEDVRLRITNQL